MKTNQLTFTRFIAATAIVIYHAYSGIWPFHTPYIHQFFDRSNLAVSYFFILSGFVMIIAYGAKNVTKIKSGDYYLNRFARIYPVYFIALVLTFIFQFSKRAFPVIPFFSQLFVLQAWFPGLSLKLNAPGWSISVEALFYLSFPLLFNFYRKYSFKLVLTTVLLLWLTTQILLCYLLQCGFYHGFPSKSHDFLFYFPLMHINEFTIGNVAGLFYLRLRNKQRNLDFAVIFIVAIMVICFSLVPRASFLHDGLAGIIFVPLILLLALNNGKISSVFSNKYLLILGEASYTMYILQSPIRTFSFALFKKMHVFNNNIQFYVFFVILVSVSICCYFFVEIPAKNWIKGFKLKKAELQPISDAINF
jgi:peptidoglycan/LPS O-acetylase OafA/YrhL